jgi:pilus assembly protein Flp/PilA
MNKHKIVAKIQRFLADESGPTAVEYAVMLAMIIVGCIGAILSTGDVQKAMFEDSVTEMNQFMYK